MYLSSDNSTSFFWRLLCICIDLLVKLSSNQKKVPNSLPLFFFFLKSYRHKIPNIVFNSLPSLDENYCK